MHTLRKRAEQGSTGARSFVPGRGPVKGPSGPGSGALARALAVPDSFLLRSGASSPAISMGKIDGSVDLRGWGSLLQHWESQGIGQGSEPGLPSGRPPRRIRKGRPSGRFPIERPVAARPSAAPPGGGRRSRARRRTPATRVWTCGGASARAAQAPDVKTSPFTYLCNRIDRNGMGCAAGIRAASRTSHRAQRQRRAATSPVGFSVRPPRCRLVLELACRGLARYPRRGGGSSLPAAREGARAVRLAAPPGAGEDCADPQPVLAPINSIPRLTRAHAYVSGGRCSEWGG